MTPKTPSVSGSESPLAGRLRKRARHLDRWARRSGLDAYRIFDRDIPGYHFAVDRYADWLWSLQRNTPGLRAPKKTGSADRRAAPSSWRSCRRSSACLPNAPSSAHISASAGERLQYARRPEAGQTLVVQEGELQFEVNLGAYLDTGLFLDHRTTRARVGAEARGKRFLNLFAYTGSFTAHAAAGGAASSVSVDLSKNYLDWAQRNLKLNRLSSPSHRLVRQDAEAYLRREGRLGRRAASI